MKKRQVRGYQVAAGFCTFDGEHGGSGMDSIADGIIIVPQEHDFPETFNFGGAGDLEGAFVINPSPDTALIADAQPVCTHKDNGFCFHGTRMRVRAETGTFDFVLPNKISIGGHEIEINAGEQVFGVVVAKTMPMEIELTWPGPDGPDTDGPADDAWDGDGTIACNIAA